MFVNWIIIICYCMFAPVIIQQIYKYNMDTTKTIINVPESRFLKLESNMAEILEHLKAKTENPVLTGEKKLYTPEQFCKLFDMSRSTFDRMKRENKIIFTNLGRRIYIDEKEVARILTIK